MVTKYRWQASALVLVAFMLGCNEFMVVGVLSDIARSLRVTVATAGYLVTTFCGCVCGKYPAHYNFNESVWPLSAADDIDGYFFDWEYLERLH